MSCKYCRYMKNTNADEPYWLPKERLNDVGQTMALWLSSDGQPALRVHAESEDGSYRHESFFGPVYFCPHCGDALSGKTE